MTNVTKLADWRHKEEETEDLPDPAKTDPLLKHGGGSGTSGGMETVDAKIAASEARTDTKFAELRGDLKVLPTASQLRNTVWTAAATIIGVAIAAIALGGDRFDAGMGMADVRQAQLQRDAKQDESVKSIEGKIDALIAAQKSEKPTNRK